MVGLHNTMGFMARSAHGIEDLARQLLAERSVASVTDDPRFVPLPWREEVAKAGKKLKIGW